jgi:hypothetical protein
LLGGSVATAIYASIIDNQFRSNLPGKLAAAITEKGFDPANVPALLKAATANTAAAYAKVPGITKNIVAVAQSAVKLSYVEAFKVVYYTALGFAVLAIGSALLVRDVDPAKKTLEKAVILENERPKAISEKVVEEV